MMGKRARIITTIIVSVLLLIAILPLPYGYYTFLRWATCSMAAYIAYVSYQRGAKWLLWIFVPIAVLFNPILPIHLSKEIWQPIDFASAIIFGVSAFVLRKP